MADNIFSNFEPVDETKVVANGFDNIKPFYSSPYGHSRLFTAIYQGKKVIIKTLKPEFAQDEQSRKNLKKEYEYTSQLDNRFVRRALGYESIQSLGESIILEYVDGKSLAEHIRVGTLNEKQVKSVIIDLCDGLSYMHRNGVVHCDLKPENVMVTADDYRVKIIDIGLPETDYKTDHELLIKENEFIAPELFKGEEADPRSDVYSVGKIIEFIIARNILNQFSSVATHCIQFSREQRFDNILAVKSEITKSHSYIKLVLCLVALVILGIVAYLYIPKIVEKVKAEKATHFEVEFHQNPDKDNAESVLPIHKSSKGN